MASDPSPAPLIGYSVIGCQSSKKTVKNGKGTKKQAKRTLKSPKRTNWNRKEHQKNSRSTVLPPMAVNPCSGVSGERRITFPIQSNPTAKTVSSTTTHKTTGKLDIGLLKRLPPSKPVKPNQTKSNLSICCGAQCSRSLAMELKPLTSCLYAVEWIIFQRPCQPERVKPGQTIESSLFSPVEQG
jgi:hypothetical protein